MPGSMYVELALALVRAARPQLAGPVCLQDLTFPSALLLQESAQIDLSLKLDEIGPERYLFSCLDAQSDTLYASLEIEPGLEGGSVAKQAAAKHTACEARTALAYYAALAEKGNDYGPNMHAITALYQEPNRAWAKAVGLDEALLREGFQSDPVLLDGAIQSLAATYDGQEGAFVLTGIDRLQLSAPFTGGSYFLQADLDRRPDPSDATALGNVTVFDERDDVVADLSGIRLRYLEPTATEQSSQAETKTPLVVNATFTAEPLEESLVFWGQELDRPVDVQFGPYNQVLQQLLDPASQVRKNREGANVVLFRSQDWYRGGASISLHQGQERIDACLAAHPRHILPNGLEVAHLNQYETDYLFKEIFIDRSYLRHGIEVRDGDCIFDIGANIGLFTLFMQSECKNPRIYAFEPSPIVAQLLKANAALYGSDVHVFECGVSDVASEADFTFYESSSVFSSFGADVEADAASVRAVVRNIVSASSGVAAEDLESAVDDLMANRMDSRTFTCQLRSVSEVIAEQGIAQIDLLKVDAEKSELPILEGIKDEDWPKIRQVVAEVHDAKGPIVKSVEELLRRKGFELTMEETAELQGSGLSTIYAIRKDANKTGPADDARASNAAKLEAMTLEFATALRAAAEESPVPYIAVSCPATPTTQGEVDDDSAAAMEQLLAKELGSASNVHLVTSHQLQSQFPVDDFASPEGDRLGHVPYSADFYHALGSSIARKFDMVKRRPYKVIALDCDNTLWGGVCGEDAPQDLDLGGPWHHLQAFMLARQKQGMLLCLCSKNVEGDVFRVFDARADMPLSLSDIAAHRINWSSKSENLKAMASALGLGLNSFIFIDDNAVECAEVRAHCPEVLTLQLPRDPKEIPSYLEHVWAFDGAESTAEDQSRTRLYQDEGRREKLRAEAPSLKDFIAGLGLDIGISAPTEAQLPRVAQLTQRTNQFNFTTIRRNEAELRSLLQEATLSCLAVEVNDRFGHYGLVGVLLFAEKNDRLAVDSFLLSCRVLGRGVEHRLVATLGEEAMRRGCAAIDLPFVPTAKNTPAKEFLLSLGAVSESDEAGWSVFSMPAQAAVAVVYDPDASYLCGHDEAAGTLATKIVGDAGGVAAVDYQKIAELCTKPKRLFEAIEAARRRRSETPMEGYVPPSSDQERSIAQVWERVLGIGKVGVAHTFKELGGDSLKSVMLLTHLKRELGVDLSIADLFEFPTVRAMAKTLDGARRGETSEKENPSGAERGARMRQRKAARRRGRRD